MSCEQFHPHISALADSQLEPELVHQVRRHLDTCSACAELYSQQVELNSLVRDTQAEVDPPAYLWKAIEHRIRQASSPRGLQKTGADRIAAFLQAGWLAVSGQPASGGRLRYALAALMIVFVASIVLLQIRERSAQEQILAEIESFEWAVAENPFLELDESGKATNPFRDFRSSE